MENPYIIDELRRRARNIVSLDAPTNESLDETLTDLALGFVPVVGTAQAVRDFERSRRDNDKLGMVLSTAAAIPIVGGVAKAVNKGRKTKAIIDALRDDDLAENVAKTLDMSDAARMARAADQGFDTARPLLHGTGRDFPAFDPSKSERHYMGKGTHLAESPGLASKYAEQWSTGSNVIPVYTKGGLRLADEATYNKYYFGIRSELEDGVYSGAANWQDELANRQDGFDGVRYQHPAEMTVPGESRTVDVIFDPANIRSVNAKFDPANIGKNDLLGAATIGGMAAAGAVGAGALGAQSAYNDYSRKPREAYFGYPVRNELSQGESEYFRKNPGVAGMAASDNRIILNPYAKNVNFDAVAMNEGARLWMRENSFYPQFDLTEEQRQAFIGTAYENDEQALKQSILARIISGDPSAGNATKEQRQLAKWLGNQLTKVDRDGGMAAAGVQLSPSQEAEFQRWAKALPWYREFARRHGAPPTLDDPNYDYRKAWLHGISPRPYQHDGGAYHWPSVAPDGSSLKGENHPTKWMEDYKQKFGKDPNVDGVIRKQYK